MSRSYSRREVIRLGAGALVAGGVAGCGGSKGSKASGGGGSAGHGGKTDVTINYWTHDKVLSVPLIQYWAKRLSDSPDSKYRYTIKSTIVPPDTLPTKARAAFLAHSNAPDLLNIEIDYFSLFMPVAESTLVDLTDTVAPVRDKNVPNLYRTYSANGRVYGLELSLDMCTYYLRPEQFKAIGLPTRFDTWDDLLQAGLKYAVPKGKYLGAVSSGSPQFAAVWFLPYLVQAGGQLFQPDGSVGFRSSEAATALAFLTKAVQEKVFLALSNPFAGPGAAALKRGEVIGTSGPDFYKSVLQQLVSEQKKTWRVDALPAFSTNAARTSIWGGSSWSVAKSSPVADAAIALVKAALLSEEAQVHKYEQVGFKPTWLSAYSQPAIKDSRDSWMNGEKLGALYGELAPKAPIMNQSPHWNSALNALNDGVLQAISGRKNPTQALSDAANALEQQIKSGS